MPPQSRVDTAQELLQRAVAPPTSGDAADAAERNEMLQLAICLEGILREQTRGATIEPAMIRSQGF